MLAAEVHGEALRLKDWKKHCLPRYAHCTLNIKITLSNITQLVRGTGSLVRLGARSPGWEAVATDFLELLVALAGRGHGEVEGAVVGGLAAVVALLRPSALREGSRFHHFHVYSTSGDNQTSHLCIIITLI